MLLGLLPVQYQGRRASAENLVKGSMLESATRLTESHALMSAQFLSQDLPRQCSYSVLDTIACDGYNLVADRTPLPSIYTISPTTTS